MSTRVSTRPMAAASAQAWRTEETLGKEARRELTAPKDGLASHCGIVERAWIRGNGGRAAGCGGSSGVLGLGIVRVAVIAIHCGGRDDDIGGVTGLERGATRLLHRVRGSVRAGARHPLGSCERLEQPREEQHQHGQRLDSTNGADHPCQSS